MGIDREIKSGNRNFTLIVLVTLLTFLALYLRIGAVNHSYVHAPVRADAQAYYSYAYNLRNFGVYSRSTDYLKGIDTPPKPDALRSPGYSLLITPLVSGLPNNRIILNITLLHVVLSVLTVIICFAIYRRFLPDKLAAIPTLLTAISPHLINMNIYILSESLFTFLCALFVWLFIQILEKTESKWPAMLMGLVMGYTTLTRPSLQYFVVLLVIFMFLVRRGNGIKIGNKQIVLLVLAYCIVVLPWHVRNLDAIGSMSDNYLKVNALHHGVYPDLMYKGRPETFGFPYRFDPKASEISQNMENLVAEIQRRFTEETAVHLQWYLIGKPVTLWSWNSIQGMGDSFIYEVTKSPYFEKQAFIYTHAVMRKLHYPLVIIAALTSIFVWLPYAKKLMGANALIILRFISMVLVYFMAVHIATAPFPRYNIPLRPYMHGFAILGVWLSYLVIKAGVRSKRGKVAL